jgi:hypothetical protein
MVRRQRHGCRCGTCICFCARPPFGPKVRASAHSPLPGPFPHAWHEVSSLARPGPPVAPPTGLEAESLTISRPAFLDVRYVTLDASASQEECGETEYLTGEVGQWLAGPLEAGNTGSPGSGGARRSPSIEHCPGSTAVPRMGADSATPVVSSQPGVWLSAGLTGKIFAP